MVFTTDNQPHRPLSFWQRAVLYHLTDRAAREGGKSVLVTTEAIARDLGTSRRQVFKAIRRLKQLGYLASTQVNDDLGRNLGARYTIMDTDPRRRAQVYALAETLGIAPVDAMWLVWNLTKQALPVGATLGQIAQLSGWTGDASTVVGALAQAGIVVLVDGRVALDWS